MCLQNILWATGSGDVTLGHLGAISAQKEVSVFSGTGSYVRGLQPLWNHPGLDCAVLGRSCKSADELRKRQNDMSSNVEGL